MDIDFWLERWINGQTGFHQAQINAFLERFWPSTAADENLRVFVPLCGKSLDMHWLLAQGHAVIGCELSTLAVETFFSESGMKPEIRHGLHCVHWQQGDLEILCGDFFNLTQADTGMIDAFYDRASLIALPPSLRPAYASHLAGLLGKGTKGLLITLDYNQDQIDGPPFAVPATEVERLFSSDFEIRQVYSANALDENPKFRERGLTELSELVFILKRR